MKDIKYSCQTKNLYGTKIKDVKVYKAIYTIIISVLSAMAMGALN